MHHFMPLARLIEHLGDANLIDASEVPKLLEQARRLNQQRFSNEHIINALFNWHFYRRPELRAEVDRFQENGEEHRRLSRLHIPKGELLQRMQPHLNGEWEDIVTAFADIDDATPITSDQAIYKVPPHHPKAIDALVLVFLGHAKVGTPTQGGIHEAHDSANDSPVRHGQQGHRP